MTDHIPTRPRITLEICTASAEDCIAAQNAGADRLELNCALMLGGLTPSLGTLREALVATRLPLISMIRPRPGGFCYSDLEFKAMLHDASLALEENVAGIAFGILTAAGEIDLARCRQLAALAHGRQLVFHRAFDVVPEPLKALDQLSELGFTRVMTSGQEATAYNGAANIVSYIRHAAGRIEILPAGGINRFTVEDVVRRTGCDQIHASVSTTAQDLSVIARPQVAFGGTLKPQENEFSVTDSSAVAGLRKLLGN